MKFLPKKINARFARVKTVFYSLIILVFGLALISNFSLPRVASAASCEDITCSKDNQSEEDFFQCTKDKQSCWEGKIREAQESRVTLQNTITILNGQISVQELQIDQTQTEIGRLERQITELSDRIAGLNVSLDNLTSILVKRVVEHYKRTYTNPLVGIFSKNSLNRALSEFKYVQLAGQQTAQAMERAESQRINYDEQKTLKEEVQTQLQVKRDQLEQQQATLSKQKKDQEYLLVETKHNESRYQEELAKTLAELEAIQSIIAGRGSEAKVGGVSQGDTIASIIAGASACSTGSHLHFEVAKDGAHYNPASYLKSIDASWNNQPDGSFGFSGGWEWPVENPAKINQGYGMTYYAAVKRAYGGAPHTGIDMFSKDNSNFKVKAVKEGDLYRGSIPCGGGILRYVRVEHKEGGISTYYLHINY